jgi:hypothetical protein
MFMECCGVHVQACLKFEQGTGMQLGWALQDNMDMLKTSIVAQLQGHMHPAQLESAEITHRPQAAYTRQGAARCAHGSLRHQITLSRFQAASPSPFSSATLRHTAIRGLRNLKALTTAATATT